MKCFRRIGFVLTISLTSCLAVNSIASLPSNPAPGRYAWSNVTIVAGGFVPGIQFSPVERNLIYARTDMGGAYRWDSTKARWIPLLDWVGGADANLLGVESIAPDPKDKNKVYIEVGTYTQNWAGDGAVLRSNDRGQTFARTNLPFKVGGNEDGRSMGERLAIDPSDTSILFLGSRQSGLWRSADSAKTWSKVTSFPAPDDRSDIGISFVVFDRSTATSGTPCPGIFAAATNSPTPLYHSTDGGVTWQAVPGQPTGLIPHQGKIDRRGILYVTYTNAPGPNDISSGAVWRLDTKTGDWSDITPVRPTAMSGFGYAGLALDSQRPGRLAVSTLDRWRDGDDVFRTTDDGKSWLGYREKAVRDDTLSPWLTFGNKGTSFGWWIGALAIDPFDSNHMMYGTGATIWACDDAADVERSLPTHWFVGAFGIEETAVITLVSPPTGAHLLSGVGDICGFHHDNLNISPPGGMFTNPIFNNTTSIDFAELSPNIVARTGRGGDDADCGGYSSDGGSTWSPIPAPNSFKASGPIAISADGSTIVLNGHYSTDKGANWLQCTGFTSGEAIVSDRTNPAVFYAIDHRHGAVYVSKDHARTFTLQSSLALSGDSRLYSAPGSPGDLWLAAGNDGIFHSEDYGASFEHIQNAGAVVAIGFGKSAPGESYPAIFVSGQNDGTNWISISVDKGRTWNRINDDAHQYGFTSNEITGDPRVFGRVYVATNGRGIVIGNIYRKRIGP